MMEVYNIPSAKPYIVSGIYYVRTNGVIDQGTILNNIVFYESKEIVENGFVGIIRKVQISTSILADKPEKTSQIDINGVIYNFKNPIKRQNPLYVDFWESEIKAI